MKVFLWLIFVCGALSGAFLAIGGASAISLVLAGIAGLSATVAFSALSIIAALERIFQPKSLVIPEEI